MMHFDSKEKVNISVDTRAIGVLSMRSKWTDRLKDIFKNETKPQQPAELMASDDNRKAILARKIMKVMKDPYPTEPESSSKKPKP